MRYILFLLLFMTSTVGAVEKQDCEVMDKKELGFMLGWKLGGFGLGVGPEIGFRSSSGINWSGSVQYMVAEYQELCSRYNTGRISKEQYDTEIQNIIERSRRYEREIAEYFHKKKAVIFNEMEGAVR